MYIINELTTIVNLTTFHCFHKFGNELYILTVKKFITVLFYEI
jgi:hypothetical protein